MTGMTSFPWRAVALAAVLLGLTFGAGAAELSRAVVWKVPLGPGVGSPTPYPSAEAADSVVVATGDGRVVRIDGAGNIVFTYDMGDAVGAMAACGDVDGDGATEIVAGTVRGRIVCLTGQGAAKWSYEVRHPFHTYATVVISRPPGGGLADILIKAEDGWLTCLNGQGRYRWNFHVVTQGQICSPAVADINGDGEPEYITGIWGGILALTREGRLLWQWVYPDEFARQVAVIADADRDGQPEVYMLRNGATSDLICLDGPTGRLLWSVPIPAKCYCALTVADINGDGCDEILAGTKYGDIIALSPSSQQLWKTTVGGNGIFWSPAVADIDGDGGLEVVTGVRAADGDGNSLFVLDAQGNRRGAYPQDGEGGSAVAVADFGRDGALEVVSCSRDTLFCSRFGRAAEPGRVLWPCYRGNAALTGSLLPFAAPKARPAPAPAPQASLLPNTFSTVLGDTKIPVAWSLPTPKIGYIETAFTNPRGRRSMQYFPTSPDAKSVECVLPFNRGGRYTLEVRLIDVEKRQALAQEVRTISYTSLGTEQGLVTAAAERLRRVAASAVAVAPAVSGECRRRAATLAATTETIKDRIAALPPEAEFPQDIVDAAGTLRAEVARAERFAALAGKLAAAAPGLLFAAWYDADPWDNTDPRDELPAAASDKTSFAAWTYGNQREDFCVNLASVCSAPISVRVEPQDLVGPGGAKAPWDKHVSLYQVVWMPTIFGPDVPDMLPKMNSGRTVQLSPGGFAQVWLRLDTKDLAPGHWTVTLHLQSLTMAAAAVEASLDVEVLPVALPYPYPWKMGNWASPMGFPQPLRDRVIEDLISHGSNVMYAPTPSRACDAEGNLLGIPDWSTLDDLIVKALPGDPLFFFGPLPMSAPAGLTSDSPIWKKAYAQWMSEFVAHLASLGVDRRHYAFYPVDEPGNSGHTSIDQLIAAAKLLREADPQAPIYADPAGAAYPVAWMHELDPWIDVWQPATSVAARQDLMDIMRTRDRQLWMYEAPGRVRVLSPLGFYRRQPWLALRHGARGSGFWVYHYSNLWAVGPTKEPDYGTVWIDRDEVVDSRRWQAAHDGVQDATAVLLLDEAIAAAEKAGVDKALCDKARQVRETAIAEVTINVDPDADVRFDVLQRHRRAVADMTMELRRATSAKSR